MYVSVYMPLGYGTHKGWRKVLDPLELELEVFVTHLIRVLGTEPGFWGRAANTLYHLAISPVMIFRFKNMKPGMVADSYNFCTWKVGKGRSGIQGHL